MITKLKIKRLLANGGIAKIQLAELPNGDQVVVRQLHLRHMCNPRMFKRFKRGTQTREALTPHPAVVGFFDSGFHSCRPYEIIEYVSGKNLRELVRARDPFLQSNLLRIILKSAAALAYVHESGYAHLDVKPANFLVQPGQSNGDFEIKLTDFDLTQPVKDRRDKSKAGTVEYMAPEQLKGGQIGVAADIFAFGVSAYFLATGQKPFEGMSKHVGKALTMRQDIKAKEPRLLNSDLSLRLSNLILSCLEKDPSKRIPCMSYLCQELRRV